IAVADYGASNTQSVLRALRAVGGDAPLLTADADTVRHAERVVLPGVGNFAAARRRLDETGLGEAITEVARAGRPVLGICLGLQLFLAESEEAPGVPGLGLLPGRVARFQTQLPVPHVGWARVRLVDVYVLRQAPRPAPPAQPGVEVLVLRRGPAGRSPGSWETVHGTVEPGETPVAAALRELREETGYEPVRLYNASRVEAFYRHRVDQVALGPVFAAFVDPGAGPRVSAEHDRAEWLAPSAAAARLAWPRARRALDDILSLLGGGDGGLVDDVLRVRVRGG